MKWHRPGKSFHSQCEIPIVRFPCDDNLDNLFTHLDKFNSIKIHYQILPLIDQDIIEGLPVNVKE